MIPGASCAEPSEARLRAADESVISFVIVKASEGSEGEDELQSASLLPRCVKRCFVFIHFTRFPFLLSQVLVDGKGVVLSLLRARQGSSCRATAPHYF